MISCLPPFLDFSASQQYIDRMLEILLPYGGMAAMMEAYFDESGTHEGSPVMTIAGYVFEADQCRRLTDSWAETLKENSLPYFRMSECAHGTEEFKKLNLTAPQRAAIERRMINHIRTRMTYGFAVSMSQAEFDRMAPPHFANVFGGAYAACIFLAMASVGYWARQRDYQGKVAYFFERGHAEMNDAQKRLGLIGDYPDRLEQFKYGSHTFAEKKVLLPLQAADLLAWQWRKSFIDMFGPKRKLPRRDFVALVENTPHAARHFTGELLYRFMHGSIDDAEKRLANEWGGSNAD